MGIKTKEKPGYGFLTDLTKGRGISLPNNDFRVIDVDDDDLEAALQDFAGAMPTVPIIRYRGYADTAECDEFRERFLASKATVQRGDDVPAIMIGANHYGKPMSEYARDVRDSAGDIEDIVGGFDLAGKIGGRIANALGEPYVHRPAEHNGMLAGQVRLAQWTSPDTEFALQPHEDFSQMTDPRQADFEIQKAISPIAIGLYPSTGDHGGQLRVYNLVPNENFRARIGVSHTGHPYPVSSLQGIDYVDVDIEDGDLLIFSGLFVHAVTKIVASKEHPRILMHTFAGVVPDDFEVLTWT